MTAPQSARSLVLPLALAQLIASYAGTNMDVAISVPGLLIMGIGIGVMLTASVNVVLLHTRMRRRDEPNRLVSA